jgi:hypothetical protein
MRSAAGVGGATLAIADMLACLRTEKSENRGATEIKPERVHWCAWVRHPVSRSPNHTLPPGRARERGLGYHPPPGVLLINEFRVKSLFVVCLFLPAAFRRRYRLPLPGEEQQTWFFRNFITILKQTVQKAFNQSTDFYRSRL